MKQLLTLVVALVLFTGSALAQATVDKELKQLLQTATSPIEVVVTFHGDSSPTPANLSLLNSLGITSGVSFQTLPIAGVLATASQIDALAKNEQVRSLYLNKKLIYYNYHDTHLTGVQRLRTDMEMTTKNGGLPVSGKGVTVVINDSGIDGTHEDLKLGKNLKQNVLGTTNLNSFTTLAPPTWLENVPNTDTNSGHGTHCAGTVGGLGTMSNGKYAGVATGADLIGYGSGGALFILDAIGGYDYALINQARYGIRVISNSWGSSGPFDPNNPVNVASLKAYQHNIISVFAAGNSGPGADTHNPYAVAPWVISVGAGDRYGRLADFSSRGLKGDKGTFTAGGRTWTYENRPTVVGPGVDVVSTRVLAPVSSLSVDMDAAELDPAHVPFYTHMSGTSMATPHVAGIVALMLDANPSLTADQVKSILELTATNIPGHESWEIGAGYVNAYAAVDHIFRSTSFGSTLNINRKFNSNINSREERIPFSINFDPILTSGNSETFEVTEGTTGIEAKILAGGVSGETGNPVNLSLISPDGQEYRSGIYVAFTLYHDRTVAVANPVPGTWTVKISGLNGIAIPEKIDGYVTTKQMLGATGLNDIAGHPAEASIKLAVSARLADGLSGGGFKPDEPLKRIQLADYLMMGQAVRQYMPTNGTSSFSDLKSDQLLLAESVSAKGAALRDRFHTNNGVILADGAGKFSPNGKVNRASLAYSLVQSLGLQQEALNRNGKAVTVNVDGKDYPIEDAKDIPAGLEGYVSVALELNLINAYYSVTQGPYDLLPTLHATFKPLQDVTRADFAVVITRTFTGWQTLAQPLVTSSTSELKAEPALWEKSFSYPNPFHGVTTINYGVEKDAYVTVEVFDVLGNKVQTLVAENMPAGNHSLKFDGSNLPSGTYIYRVNANGKVSSNRMMLVH
ncbi:S8/S53 family peptidase [Pontibacter korlensis]|uniref:Peptidase S8 n=1 Tax=Pontibacter korlensis TaxID=400092 RepID=A0A0E3ZE18_9BACT|nr:S8/S53 family peptidase [Pontibacter korlensis]AKD03518.1 peptidase S8 [Pontibacter korlensis]